jgi:hypothetical protein
MSKARELADVIGTQSTTENVLQGRRNLIINGDFQVWQRGTTLTTGADHFLADRWNTTPPATVSTTTSQVFDSTLQQNMVKMELNAAGGIQFQHKIENFKWAHNKKLTFSFYAKSNVSHTMQVFLRLRNSSVNDLLDQDSVSLTSTLTKFVMTFDASDLSGYTEDSSSAIQLSFSSAGLSSGDYIQLGQAQLEVGSVATPFEHRSYGEELALCQRYFYKGSTTSRYAVPLVDSWTYKYVAYELPVEMRSPPTISYQYAGNDLVAASSVSADTMEVYFQYNSRPSNLFSGVRDLTADAEL